jgi:Flp pilus assembly protein TadD
MLDKASRPDEATLALREAASVAARDPGLYRRLGDRYRRAKDAEEAERAFTNMVEVMPHESDGHHNLAEVRESQARWTDAAHHWREVIRIRSSEPTGHVRLAKVLIRAGKPDEARPVIDTLRRTAWPERFGNIADEIRQIEELARKAKK